MTKRRCAPVVAGLLVAAVALLTCTPSRAPHTIRPTEASTPEPMPTTVADLHAAIARWHRTPATITYRTERQRPGMPESVHQCLRAVVTERTEIQLGLTVCDRSGVVTLVWDPPGRWRLDVVEVGTTLTAIVVAGHGIACERPDGAEVSCRSRTIDAILSDFPFRELIVGATRTAGVVGIPPAGPVTLTPGVVAGLAARCFERGSGASAARWCFSDEGALLSLELVEEGRAPTIIEAARVSGVVDPERFTPPAAAPPLASSATP
jgi:hypothetical protein